MTISMKTHRIGIMAYPQSLRSAVYGLIDMLALANEVCAQQAFDVRVEPVERSASTQSRQRFSAVVLPPARDPTYYLAPEPALLRWLQRQRGVLCSACAGAFILAEAGVLEGCTVTTHWGLEDTFRVRFPEIRLNTNAILINQERVITAGGMMSWLDLGLELVAHFASPLVMRQLGKFLVIDTGARQQRY